MCIRDRASRVEAKLISCNPSLQDIKDEVLYCLQRSWLGAVCLGGRSFRVLCVVLKTTPLFIYINISLHTCQRVCVRFGIYFFLTYENTNGSPLIAVNDTAHANKIW